MLVIAFTGSRGSGKTFCANALLNCFRQMDIKCVKLSFSTPLKQMFHSIYSEEHFILENESTDAIHPTALITPREWYQRVGSFINQHGNQNDPFPFRRRMKMLIEQHRKLGNIVIIDDLRTSAELEAIHSPGVPSYVYHVTRDEQKRPLYDNVIDQHESEIEIPILPYDQLITSEFFCEHVLESAINLLGYNK